MPSPHPGSSSPGRQSPSSSTAPSQPLADVLSSLSFALDLTEGQSNGHAARTCLIGMRIGETIGLDDTERTALFYALLLKDLGCSSNAARFTTLFGAHDHDVKAAIKTVDWARATESFRFVSRQVAPGAFWLSRAWRMLAVFAKGPNGVREVVRQRCDRGSELALQLGLPAATAQAIRALDEHWDGRGQPNGLRGHGISDLGRIVGLAQTVEVFWSAFGPGAAFEMAAARRGRWFEPALVDALSTLKRDQPFWHHLAEADPLEAVRAAAPRARALMADDDRLDQVAEVFAGVVDAKSPWTLQHSTGVAAIAVQMGQRLGLAGADLRRLRRAALLHDIGKLGVSNLILDKPGTLTDDELVAMHRHPAHTRVILARTPGFSELADLAAAHHERLDGRGYDRGLSARSLDLSARILTVADICNALRASRPYRPGLEPDRLLAVLKRDAGAAVDVECVSALEDVLGRVRTDKDVEAPAVHVVPALSEDYQQAA